MDLLEKDIYSVISIHSTARVETVLLALEASRAIISIHSTARVETSLVRHGVDAVPNFNPLHREGGDSNTTQ